jgi:hypothetical protein
MVAAKATSYFVIITLQEIFDNIFHAYDTSEF